MDEWIDGWMDKYIYENIFIKYYAWIRSFPMTIYAYMYVCVNDRTITMYVCTIGL